MRTRLGSSVYDAVFQHVLGIVKAKGLLSGKVVGVDSTYLRADASMKSIVRKDTGDDYATYLTKICVEAGIANPTVEDAIRVDRSREGKKTSNQDWASPIDADSRIVRLKDGRTRLGYKAEHVVDLETGAVVAAKVYLGDDADTTTLVTSLEGARENLISAEERTPQASSSDSDDEPPMAPPTAPPAVSGATTRDVIEVVADKGYHKVELLLELRKAEYRTYISVPAQKGARHFGDKGGMRGREAFHDNKKRVKRKKGKALLRLRGERVERSFAFACETGDQRRVRLRGLANVKKRYLAHIAALNLGLVMRAIVGHGTPRQAAAAVRVAAVWVICMLQLAYWNLVTQIQLAIGMVLPRHGARGNTRLSAAQI